MHYANIKYCDIANGEGVRTSLFVSGCRRRCKNCFNAVAWDFAYGEELNEAVRKQLLDSLEPGYISGLSVLGGEPFEPENQRGLVGFLQDVKEKYPNKSIWCYTGYVYETDLMQNGTVRGPQTDALLDCIDILVDGPFVQELHDITLRFRGSSNQRIIDMKKTRAAGRVVLWKDDPVFDTHTMD